jgi:hypothetical protein
LKAHAQTDTRTCLGKDRVCLHKLVTQAAALGPGSRQRRNR